MVAGRRGTTIFKPDLRSAGVEPEDCSFPAEPQTECGCPAIAKAWGIGGVLLGMIGFVIHPLLFAAPALFAGIVSVRMRFRIGWFGIGLGVAQLVYVTLVMSQIREG